MTSLPTHLDEHTHPYIIKLMRAYSPHSLPQLDGLLNHKIDGHVSMEGLVKDIGLDVKQELKRRG